MKRISIILLFCSISYCLFAQSNIEYSKRGTIKSVEYTDDNSSGRPRSAKEFFSNVLKKKECDRFETIKTVRLDEGHEAYHQYYNDIKVEGAGFTLHFNKNGYLEYAHGNYIDIGSIDVVPSISKEEAFISFSKYKGINTSEISSYDAELIIKEIEGTPRLVYKVFLFHPTCEEFGYVDAHKGAVILTESAIHCVSATGTFETRYNGIRYASTEFTNGHYSLSDNSRGATIETRDLRGNGFNHRSWEIADNDNYWYRSVLPDSSYMGLDVHWALQKIYDRLYNSHNKNSFDNQGKSIKAYVQAIINGSYNNACWNEGYKSLYFGKGFYSYRPLASVDVIAHEFGHGISDYQNNWRGTGIDTLIVNEGLSDIWAVIMEYRICPNNPVWKIGDQITIYKDCFRDIENPSSTNAETQLATTYLSTQYNSGDTYVKSGVFSRWFYLLVNGGQGYNDNGDYYSFGGIGMDLAENLIVKAVYSSYLRDQYLFPDIRSAFINAARTFTNGDLEYKVANAWYAVGVGDVSWNILGESTPCGLTTYTIENVPANYTVTWQWQNGTNIPIVVDSTATYLCYIDNTNKNHINDYLTANIYNSNGNLLQTVSKRIKTGINFVGQYKQDAYNIDWTEFTNDQFIQVYSGSTVSLRSQYFYNASFSFSGTSPRDWTYDSSTNTITFYFRYYAPHDPLTPNAQILPLQGTDTLVVTGRYPNNCNTFQFTVIGNPPSLLDPDLPLLIAPSDQNVTVTIGTESAAMEADITRASGTDAETWYLTITDAVTGHTMHNSTVAGKTLTISTVGWPQGVYVVTARIRNATANGKFVIGNGNTYR